MNIYLVSAGEYDDYAPIVAFEDHADAEAFANHHNSLDRYDPARQRVDAAFVEELRIYPKGTWRPEADITIDGEVLTSAIDLSNARIGPRRLSAS